MFNKSIAYRLSIYISLAVVAVFIVFIIIIGIFNSKIVNENIEITAINESSQIIMIVEKQLISTKEISLNISEQILYYANNNDVDLFLGKLMEKYTYINAIHVNIDTAVPNILFHNYFTFRSKDSLIFENRNTEIYHCENERYNFKRFTEEKVSGWSPVFSCERNKNLVVSFYAPIQINEKNGDTTIVGSVISELSLSTLNDSINKSKIRESGYAFLVSEDGTFLTHPKKEWISTKNLYSLPDKIYKNRKLDIDSVLYDRQPRISYAYPEYLDYAKSWVYNTPIAETAWKLLIIVPEKELYTDLFILILRMLFFSVLGILIIFFIVTYITNKLIQPLSTVTTQLKKFSSFSGDSELDTMDEIKMVSESLDYLQSWYEKFKIDQGQEKKLNYQRKQDLLEASEIQMSLINTDFSSFEKRKDVDLYAIYKPARIVSGDLFDFFFLDNDNLFFSIGDVSGKGVSAAFFMSVAQTIIKTHAKLKKPGEIVKRVNNDLYTANQHQFFLTLFLGVLNLKTGILKYCNAAHTSTTILKKNNEIVELSHSHGLPLGIYPEKKYKETTYELDKEDTIVLYSDGVTELQGNEKVIFGFDNFHRSLHKLSKFNPRNLIKHLEKDLEEFQGNNKQIDDITIMAIKYKGIKKA